MKQIEESTLIEKYNQVDESGKELLESLYGKELFEKPDITERINSIDSAFEDRKYPRSFRKAPKKYDQFMQATYEAAVFTEALNEGVKLDMFNESVKRHYPIFQTNGSPSRFGFGDSRYGNAYACAGSGSRLSFKDQRLSEHAGECIKDTYRKILEG